MADNNLTYDVNTYRGINELEAHYAVQMQHEFLPDDTRLGLLSFTGGRAFGWGAEYHDLDFRGFFEADNWYRTCHSDLEGFDMTLWNLDSFDDPWWQSQRFKRYYDLRQLIWIHPELEDAYQEYRNGITPEHVLHVYPYDTKNQVSRLRNQFNPRSALHTYKEILIPLHFLRTGDIESNVVHEINPDSAYQYEWLDKCAEKYGTRYPGDFEIDEEAVWSEIYDAWDRLTEQVIENTDYEPTGQERLQ